jgi:hypothetical protein
LKEQLHKERTEERKKMMKLMEDKLLDAQYSSKFSDRWKKVLVASKPGAMVSTGDVLAEESAERKKILLAKVMKNILKKKYSHEEDADPRAVKVDSHPVETKAEETIDKKKLVLARAMRNILKKKQEKSLQHQNAIKDEPEAAPTPKTDVKTEEPKQIEPKVEVKIEHVEPDNNDKCADQNDEKSMVNSFGEEKSDLTIDPKAESDDNTN